MDTLKQSAIVVRGSADMIWAYIVHNTITFELPPLAATAIVLHDVIRCITRLTWCQDVDRTSCRGRAQMQTWTRS